MKNEWYKPTVETLDVSLTMKWNKPPNSGGGGDEEPEAS